MYGLMVESITGYLIVEFRVQKAKSPGGACVELREICTPKTLAARHRLNGEFDTVHMIL